VDVKRRIPHEGVKNDDGLPVDGLPVDGGQDTEGHVSGLTTNPGTGGDLMPRTPSTGGEFIDENDVEGHILLQSPDGLTTNPGTGGDLMPRSPSTGGEFIDENDLEGHTR
jgi:hypothetical protein